MAELEEVEEKRPVAAERPAKRTGRGRTLGALALFLSFAAVGVAGYAGWLAHHAAKEDALAAFEVRLAASEQRHRVQRDETRTLRRELEALARAEEELAALRESLAQQQDLIAEAVAESRDADSAGWRLTEVEYLMRVANHRLLMERDAGGAENLLALADEVLAETGALAYHDVRALLAEEIAALRAFEGVDAQGMFLRLEAIKGQLDELPLHLPAYSAPRPTATAAVDGGAAAADEEAAAAKGAAVADAGAAVAEEEEVPSVFDLLLERLAGLVRFRHHDGEAVRPLLPPRQAEYLLMHLRLALDRAQLAVLRHDAEIHRASLATAREWLQRFVDPTRPATERLLQELDALLATDFGGELPDISRSLSRLRDLRATPGDA